MYDANGKQAVIVYAVADTFPEGGGEEAQTCGK
jgi:hypothetical protein